MVPSDPSPHRTATQWKAEGPALRFHIGLEDVDDLKADLAAGFDRLNRAPHRFFKPGAVNRTVRIRTGNKITPFRLSLTRLATTEGAGDAMTLFAPENRDLTPRHARIWAAWEIVYTIVDFAAAFLFVVGSVFFFYASLTYWGTWMFLVGSVCFALKPTIRLVRELQYLAMGDVADVAARLSEETEPGSAQGGGGS